jgi:hypothetical protein
MTKGVISTGWLTSVLLLHHGVFHNREIQARLLTAFVISLMLASFIFVLIILVAVVCAGGEESTELRMEKFLINYPKPSNKRKADELVRTPAHTLYYVRSGVIGKSKDHGFRVLNWGTMEHDDRRIIPLSKRNSREVDADMDLIPAGFKIERKLTLRLAETRYFNPTVDESLKITIRKEETSCLTIHCKTRQGPIAMQYAVQLAGATFDEESWCSTPTAAFDLFRNRERLCTKRKVSGQYLFGFPCQAVQRELALRRESPSPSPDPKKARTAMKTVKLKEVVHMLLQKDKKLQLRINQNREQHEQDREKNKREFRARYFAYSATQKVVQDMLRSLESCLLEGRDPVYRAQQVLEQLFLHPDINKLLEDMVLNRWELDSKQLRVVKHIIANLREAVNLHKDLLTKESRRLYSILMNLCCPPPGECLQRATAQLLGLVSRRGLIAGGMRVAAQRVAIEGGSESKQVPRYPNTLRL